ncbi:MAG TPA: winged helix-turn-helix domain-containing protein [Candidatus Binatia bacterium]|nr:winged helix-turn-helix domain-containing protein [Candidatus Binatia bacterium]
MDSLEQVGDTAGLVWNTLSAKGPLTLAALKKQIKAPADSVLMAIGWLAREDKLVLQQKGRVQILCLK